MRKHLLNLFASCLYILLTACAATAPVRTPQIEQPDRTMQTPQLPMPTRPAETVAPTETSTPPDRAVEPTPAVPTLVPGAKMEPTVDKAFVELVAAARTELAQRKAIPIEEITLVDVQSVTWPDAGLGCPQPGMAYAQVQVDGVLIRFRTPNGLYEYHGGGTRKPFLCERS